MGHLYTAIQRLLSHFNRWKMDSDLRRKIDEWHRADNHQKIIDTIEKIPETKRDFETTGLLARAYNNIEDHITAINLLESIREKGENDFLWNFRMGYTKYSLDQIREALRYFNRAVELDPTNDDARCFIRVCNLEIPFSKRVEDFWNWFVKNESELSGMIPPDSNDKADALTAFVHEGTCLISEKLYFYLGGDYEFTFSIEGWPDLFILYPHIISRMPQSLKNKWHFQPFNQGIDRPFGFRMYGTDIDTARIMVRALYLEDKNRFCISYYEKNLNALPKRECDNFMWIILEHILGEGISFIYMDEIVPAEAIEDGMIPLSELKGTMEMSVKAGGREFFDNPKDLYTGYQISPQERDELRYDVIAGTTCLEGLVADYYNDSTRIFDHINSFGAHAMFIAFGNIDRNDGDIPLDFRHELEDRLSNEILEPKQLGQVIGGATGVNMSYIDLIVFNRTTFINIIKPLLLQYKRYSFYLSDFKQHAEIIPLTEA